MGQQRSGQRFFRKESAAQPDCRRPAEALESRQGAPECANYGRAEQLDKCLVKKQGPEEVIRVDLPMLHFLQRGRANSDSAK